MVSLTPMRNQSLLVLERFNNAIFFEVARIVIYAAFRRFLGTNRVPNIFAPCQNVPLGLS